MVEMLVTISIVCILAALVFGGSGKAIEKARQASCMSNMRQISAALMTFVGEHDGWLPEKLTNQEARDQGYDLGGNTSAEIMWSKQLTPYIGAKNTATSSITGPENRIFICPSAKLAGFNKETISRAYTGTGAFVPTSGKQEDPRKIASIENPSQTMLITEGKLIAGSGSASCNSICNWSAVQADIAATSVASAPNLDFRHGEKLNVIYADGHVASFAFADRKTITRPMWDGRNWNP